MPLVSVILPCYNAVAQIGSAIRSICDQTFKDWELIVVDDASTDDTAKEIAPFLNTKVFLLRLERNFGYPTAMNEGIARSTGKFIARMDADDISNARRLEEQIKALNLFPAASFCGVARYRITPGGKEYTDRLRVDGYYKTETWEDLIDGSRIFTDPSVMIDRKKLDAVGGYRTYQRSGMDVDLWLRAMERFGPCVTITTPLFGKRLEPGSIIFNPQTHLINQVPRVLAKQRRERGSDDIQEGKAINLKYYAEMGWIRQGERADKIGLFLGAIVTCLWLRDWKGVRVYFTALKKKSDLSLVRIAFIVVKKFVQRMHHNPYTQNSTSA